MASPLLEGAEPYASYGGADGALVLHGFTGQPHSVRPLALAFEQAGFSVEMPLLPGHGTSIDDLETCEFSDWTDHAEAVYRRLASRCRHVVVAGLSMGGTIALYLAERHPQIRGLVLVNPVVGQSTEENFEALRYELAQGRPVVDLGPSDVERDDASGNGYVGAPIRPLISLLEGAAGVEERLSRLEVPILLLTSRHDNVVPPSSSDTIVESAGGPVERVFLEHSAHVATLDNDAEELERRAVAFAKKVVSQ